mgnify:CR=1 FL=1
MPLTIAPRAAGVASRQDAGQTAGKHGFAGARRAAKQERGYVLSFTGNVTFKRNADLRLAVEEAPAEQLLVETDAPYMTAEPFRGARNESTFIGWQARCMAEARGMSAEDMAVQLTANAERVYGISVPALG